LASGTSSCLRRPPRRLDVHRLVGRLLRDGHLHADDERRSFGNRDVRALSGCIVPSVKLKPWPVALAAIKGAHCSLGTVTRRRSANAYKNLVLYQTPAPGTHLPAGGKVNLVIGKGKHRRILR
jgi:PASTA domain